ncbi:MAG: TolC family protein [Bdellovibrionaceae bacterium]|nr:TolC family protein [Pseudobdellovibrionaceae bacterium]
MSGLLLLSLFLSPLSRALEFDTYFNQVKEYDPGLKASEALRESVVLTQSAADQLTDLHLFSQINSVDDRRPTANPSFQGGRTRFDSWSLGIRQQTSFGLSWTLSQNLQTTRIFDAASLGVPVPEYSDSYPRLELGIPLWRNFWGSETREIQEQAVQSSKAQKIEADISYIQKIIEIEGAFDRLATYQETFEFQKESLERARKILAWSRSRLQRGLADEAEVYGAQAALAARELELIQGRENLAEAMRIFNRFRGHPEDSDPGRLKPRKLDLSQLVLHPSEGKKRLDFLAQNQSASVREAASRASKQSNLPKLDLGLILQSQSRSAPDAPEPIRAYWERNKDYFAINLKFSMPLDQFKTEKIRNGYEFASKAASLTKRDLENRANQTWSQTVSTGRQLYEQLKIVEDLEKIQKLKADHERDRYSRGRSTGFQVLSYEQDYLNSKNQKLQLELQARNFISSLRLFVSE